MRDDILLAAAIAPHGLKGEVRLKLFTDEVGKLRTYGPLQTRDGRYLKVTAVRATGPDEAVVRFEGVNDRTGAEALKGAELFVKREALPALADGEFYHADLIGLAVQDSEDRILGKVRAIHNYGAGDVIEIARDDGDSVLLAFTRVNVPVIDVSNRRIVVAVPEEVEAGGKGNVE